MFASVSSLGLMLHVLPTGIFADVLSVIDCLWECV